MESYGVAEMLMSTILNNLEFEINWRLGELIQEGEVDTERVNKLHQNLEVLQKLKKEDGNGQGN